MEGTETQDGGRMRVGMIGMGMMGGAIARNILRHGFDLSVIGHRRREMIDSLIAEGAVEVDNAAQLARVCDVVMICVTGTHQVKEIIWGANGLLQGAHAGLVVVDASTSDPELADEAVVALAATGARFLDAPVNRTPKEAEQGRLNVLVGGDAATLEKVRPVMATYSETIHHLGAPGAGYKAKLIHNFVAQANTTVLAEAMCTAAKVGLDLNEFVALCRLSGAHSKSFDRVVPYILSGDDSGQRFAMRNAVKDMWSYTQLTSAAQVSGIVAEAVRQTYVIATNLGYGDAYVPRLFDVLGAINGTTVRAARPDADHDQAAV